MIKNIFIRIQSLQNFTGFKNFPSLKSLKALILAVALVATTGCGDYLDLVPEGVATLENAFSNRINTEKFLLTCFSRMPNPAKNVWTAGLIGGGDEIWWCYNQWPEGYEGAYIARGYQNANEPYLNHWDDGNGADNLFVGIRDCNIFLENVHLPHDLPEYEKTWWSAEVKFLKAYMHYYLMTLYGPIPVIRENLPVNASPEQVRMYREPVDDVVNYIVELIDEAMPGLPNEITAHALYDGRISKPVAAAIKARALVWAASPLFNGGNPEYALFKDNKGRQLISSVYDPKKWERAATAIKEAIDLAHAAGHELYEYSAAGAAALSNETLLKYTLRYAITDRFNQEIVWGGRDPNELQSYAAPLFAAGNYNSSHNYIGAPLKIAEQFYTDKGIPIDEDPTWDYSNRYSTRNAGEDHKYYIHVSSSADDRTANLNFNREPRFHAWLGFDRGVFEGAGKKENESYWLQMRQGEASGMRSKSEHNVAGYQIKKMVHPESAYASETSNTFNRKIYSFPLARLTDLYLLYAEALNESVGPGAETYRWIDVVRKRAGLDGVENSWKNSSNQNKPYSKETLREIIKRERLIELCFEGHRPFDLRRWMDALKYYNEPVIGMNYNSPSVDGYNTPTVIWNKRVFTLRDYLWPIKTSSIVTNSNLVQNPGW